MSYVEAIDELIESGEWADGVNYVPWRDTRIGTPPTPMTGCRKHPNRFPANEQCPRCETEEEAAWMRQQDREYARRGGQS